MTQLAVRTQRMASLVPLVPLVTFLVIGVVSAVARAQYLQHLFPRQRMSSTVLMLFVTLVPVAHCIGCLFWAYGSSLLASNYFEQPRYEIAKRIATAIALGHWPLVVWAAFVWYWSALLNPLSPSLDEFEALTRSARMLERPSAWAMAAIAASHVGATTPLRRSGALFCVLAPFGVLQLLSEALRPLVF